MYGSLLVSERGAESVTAGGSRDGIARRGFTLVEVLLVVVIVAIVSAVVIVQMQYNARHAELTTLRYNEATLNQLISVYKNDHFGRLPEVKDDTLPQLLSTTDAAGTIGDGAQFRFGPYVIDGEMPVNFRTGSNRVSEIAVYPPAAYRGGGWLYHPPSGRIVADHKPGNPFKALVTLPRFDGLTPVDE